MSCMRHAQEKGPDSFAADSRRFSLTVASATGQALLVAVNNRKSQQEEQEEEEEDRQQQELTRRCFNLPCHKAWLGAELHLCPAHHVGDPWRITLIER